VTGHDVVVTLESTGAPTGTVTPITAQELVDELNDTVAWPDLDGLLTAALSSTDKDNAGAANDGSGSVAVAVSPTAMTDASNSKIGHVIRWITGTTCVVAFSDQEA
jgi:hypothetical protein